MSVPPQSGTIWYIVPNSGTNQFFTGTTHHSGNAHFQNISCSENALVLFTVQLQENVGIIRSLLKNL
jgi:hypothetical protein